MRSVYGRLALGTMIAAVLVPFIPLVMWSLSERWFYPALWPQAWGWRAWSYLLGPAGEDIVNALVQSLAVAGTTAVLSVLVGSGAGRVLGLYSFRGKDLISVLLALPVIVPPLCVTMGLHLWFIHLYLAETFIGVVLVHLTVCCPYAIFVMWGVFSNYNPDFEAQARSLGASPGSVLWRVMLPLIYPGLIVAALFSFMLSWSQYVSTLIIGGGEITTLPILLFALMNSSDRPVAAAVSLVFVAPALLVLLPGARYLGRSSVTGGV